jgi:hypothetical protein
MFKQQLKHRQQSAIAHQLNNTQLNNRGEAVNQPMSNDQLSQHYLQADPSDIRMLESMKDQAKRNNDFNSHAALTRLQKNTILNNV